MTSKLYNKLLTKHWNWCDCTQPTSTNLNLRSARRPNMWSIRKFPLLYSVFFPVCPQYYAQCTEYTSQLFQTRAARRSLFNSCLRITIILYNAKMYRVIAYPDQFNTGASFSSNSVVIGGWICLLAKTNHTLHTSLLYHLGWSVVL